MEDRGHYTNMTNFQAFCRGFASAWDFTRPFSEKASAGLPSEKVDFQWIQELDLNVGYWEAVGNHLRKAISDYEKEISGNVSKQ